MVEAIHDPILNRLEAELNCHNQSIANAMANYFQSRALVDEARAAYFPTLVGALNAIRQKSGGGATPFISNLGGTTTAGTASTGSIGSVSTITTTYSAFLAANWEPDIWGLVRRTVERKPQPHNRIRHCSP